MYILGILYILIYIDFAILCPVSKCKEEKKTTLNLQITVVSFLLRFLDYEWSALASMFGFPSKFRVNILHQVYSFSLLGCQGSLSWVYPCYLSGRIGTD